MLTRFRWDGSIRIRMAGTVGTRAGALWGMVWKPRIVENFLESLRLIIVWTPSNGGYRV